ncbi:cobalt-precorrin-7 (C(5))-methyltransferase [Methanothermobacter tenebrarum]|uniref:Cobalt-precorrin-7 (C(5))-methyltransferase n=1 Tax=Methanothermobacter tenebrarum TaxID=680118 RepID=A0A328P977_9EURY|nr:cobalt-precorrin-7 (C(5))-methyltransferase [Methanothermobacter tenebrarum]NPV63898.1 cobalt-precorrin-7 (C(5))-methyltransferase [Methanobacteriaceae archaeon]RAO79077.1 cobalt-precorrin-7 (C(5))-methyltransferase [Methanothermobacter tenebrarum]
MVLYLVGAGPGSPDFVTPAAKKAVKKSDLVVGSERVLKLFDEKKEKITLNGENVKERLEEAVKRASKGETVSIISTGDPGFSGVLNPVNEIMKKLDIEVDVQVIPGISSIQLCAARLLLPWNNADILTLHGRKDDGILKVIDNGRPTIILPSKNPSETASFLIKNGVDPQRKVAICERLSYPDERVMRIKLKDVKNSKFSYMCVMVIY